MATNNLAIKQNLSSSTALRHFMSQIYAELNESTNCVGMFVYLLKDFDRVDHSTQLTQLYEDGIR